MRQPTIGIVGAGFVGSAIARGFMEHAEVRIYDVDKRKATHAFDVTIDSDFVFVQLPTPRIATGIDTKFLDQFFATAIAHYKNVDDKQRCIVIKSTVPVGYTRCVAARFKQERVPPRVVHSPEFLTARCANVDFQTPSRNLIGHVGVNSDFNPSWDAALDLVDLYADRFPGTQTLTMQADESELAKLSCNAFFAMKVAFFNMVQRACVDKRIEFEAVKDGILSDGRISHSHTQVPGPDGGFGFGGACLPKDLWQFARDVTPDDADVVEAIWRLNDEVHRD